MNGHIACGGILPGNHSSSVLDDLSGRCDRQGLVSEYNALFFGSLIINQDEPVSPQSTRITNVGKTDIGILSVRVTRGTPNFKLAGNTVYPRVLRAGESFLLTVAVSFDKIGQLGGVVEINTNEDRLPYTVGLGGRVVGANFAFDGEDGEDGQGGPVPGSPEDLLLKWLNLQLQSINDRFMASLNEERWARADADSAEAGYRLTLAAALRGETEARVMVEYIARVTALEAEALARLTLDARVGENEASLENIQRAYANGFEAEALARQTLEATINGRTDALFVNERIAYANLFSAESTERTLLEARVRDYTNASITEERITRANQFEAETIARTEQQTLFQNDVNARLVQEAITRANALAAEAASRTLLNTNIRNLVSATAADEVRARSTADEAMASRLRLLETNYASGSTPGVDTFARARIIEEQEARANADLAEALSREALETFFDTEVSRATALIEDERIARTTAVSSLVQRTNNLVAQLNLTIPSTLGNRVVSVDARVTEEATSRVTQYDSLARRLSTLEATYTGGDDDGSGVDTLARAQIQDEMIARASADEVLGGRIVTIQTDYQNADNNLSGRIVDEATARATAIDAEARARESLAVALRGETDTKVTAAVTTERNARVSADGALSGRVDTLTASYVGSGGNLLRNSDFNTLNGWSIKDNLIGASAIARNASGPDWQPGGIDDTLGIASGVPTNSSYYVTIHSDPFAVKQQSWIQFYIFSSSHRSKNWITLFFYDINGNEFAYAGDINAPRWDNGGRAIAAWDQIGLKSYQVPVGAVYARMAIRKYDTFPGQSINSSVAWWWHPYVGEAREGQTSWNPYVTGTGGANTQAFNAALTFEQEARANAILAEARRADSLVATLRGDASGWNTDRYNQGVAVDARVAAEEIARVRDDTALGQRITNTEALTTVEESAMSRNSRFKSWPNGQVNPTAWSTYTPSDPGAYTIERISGLSGSPYGVRTANNAGYTSGFYQQIDVVPGKYILKATVRNEAGDLSGAGVTLGGLPGAFIHFLTDPDINGVIGQDVGSIRTWTKEITVATGGPLGFHAMQGWVGFGVPIASHYLHWYEVSLIPTSYADRLSTKNTARITAEEIARTDADQAQTRRSDKMEANTISTRGITPNGALTSSADGWELVNGAYWVGDVGDAYGCVRSPEQTYAHMYGPTIAIQPGLTYRVRTRFASRGYGLEHYIGVQCYNSQMVHLGNVYLQSASGQVVNYDWIERTGEYNGEFNYGDPFVGGVQFHLGTRFVKPMFLMNYPNTSPPKPGFVDVDYLFLEEVTTVKALFSEEQTARTTADDAQVRRIVLAETEYRQNNTDRFNQATSARTRADEAYQASSDETAARVLQNNNIITDYQTRDRNRYDQTVTAQTRADQAYDTVVSVNAARLTVEENYRAMFARETPSGLNTYTAYVDGRVTAVASDLGVEAGKISSLRVDLNGTTSVLNETRSVAIRADGRTSYYWGVVGNSPEGRVALELRAGDGSAPGFDITGNTRIFGNLLVTGTVNTGALANNAVTNTILAGVADVVMSGGSPGDPQFFSSDFAAIQATGGKIRIDTQFDVNSSGGAAGYITANLVRTINGGGETIVSKTYARTTTDSFTFWVIDEPGAGTIRYFLRLIKYSTQSGFRTWTVGGIQFAVLETKR